ncbi:adhesion protein FadA [Leptotrichia sp. oral taxon 847]|uniref:adhesion protein FadA n=1 Tax=Leptotrichia sp. oral taxon 847 TaxID=1785996 RepID=UPI00076821CC|nr:adhesion protein FadA [Leptotrichia sp. oral taxon 847]AMD94309.1 hypothetical protein AXF11_01000 [Leptotrichia sp. oral taxon 847]
MKKMGFLLMGIMIVSTTAYSAVNKNSIENSLNSIENQYNELLKKEAAQKESYERQVAQLKAEVEDLTQKRDAREKTIEKLKKDSEVRWLRDKYKAVLNEYEKYSKNIEKMINAKEQKITELETLLSVMN